MSASTSDENQRAEPPLWAIGLTVGTILAAPIALYSFAPTAPLREGDTVFSEGEQRVQYGQPSTGSERDESCLLDPGNPLIILQRTVDRSDGNILARVQGNAAIEWPFCPPDTTVLLKISQISQNPHVLGGVTGMMSHVFSR